MIWAFDIDGVITSNPDFFKWWIYQLRKKGNNNKVAIISARNPSRMDETLFELERWGIDFDEIYSMTERLKRDMKSQAKWKLSIIKQIHPDVWVDNDFKVYEKVLGVRMDTPGTERIQI